jgi:hypothetical protein
MSRKTEEVLDSMVEDHPRWFALSRFMMDLKRLGMDPEGLSLGSEGGGTQISRDVPHFHTGNSEI